MTLPIAKSGSLYSPTFLDFVRTQPCYFCMEPAPSQAHHWPPKGRGVTRDDKTLPACVVCHKRCHGERVVDPRSGAKLGPIAAHEQVLATAMMWRRFWDTAHVDQLVAVAREMFALRGGGQEVAW